MEQLILPDAINLEDDAVVLLNGGNGLPTGTAIDTVYYVIFVDVNNIQLSATPAGGNILLTNDGGADNTILRRTLDIRYIFYVTDVTKYSPQFIHVLVAKLESEWAEPLVKATTLGDRKDAKLERKMAESRSLDGQEGTPDVQDTSTWIDAR